MLDIVKAADAERYPALAANVARVWHRYRWVRHNALEAESKDILERHTLGQVRTEGG